MSATPKPGKLRITWLVPMAAHRPAGGFKVTYEYANFLASRGHQVNVVHGNILRVDTPLLSMRPKAIVRTLWNYIELKFSRRYRPDAWFTVSPDVNVIWAQSLAAKYIPDGDIVFATAWETAEWALTYPSTKGRLFYLIQHLETWSGPEERVMATWTAPLEKIVIASWLQKIATDLGERSHLINNGIDLVKFTMTVPPEDRDPHELLMLFHHVEWKGSADGLAAFAIAKQSIPELHLTLFGIDVAPPDLPAGIEYHHQPSPKTLNDLYNRAAVFISPSWTEGWGLPPAEALLCGGAIAVTRGGADEAFAIHNETALVSPIKDPAALAANIVRLVCDKELRLRLACQGRELIQQFTWKRSGEALEAAILAPPYSVPAEADLQTASKS
jgi:glycosyltransferase involved in cell wall biosynthesis